MAAIGTRLVRPILTLLILRFLTSSQAAVRPMLSMRAASATDTRMNLDSMTLLLSGLRSHDAKPRRLCFADLLEADSFLGEVAFEPIPEPDEEMCPVILGRECLGKECSSARRASSNHLTEEREIPSSATFAD